MNQDQNRKLTPLQMEQFIIHLKSEIQKYKSKTEVYKKEIEKQTIKDMSEQNLSLLNEVTQLKQLLTKYEDEHKKFNQKNESYEKEILACQQSILECKQLHKLELEALKEIIAQYQQKENELTLKQSLLLEEIKALKTDLNNQQQKNLRLESLVAEFDKPHQADANNPSQSDVMEEIGSKDNIKVNQFSPISKGGWSQLPSGVVSFQNSKKDASNEMMVGDCTQYDITIDSLLHSSSPTIRGKVDPFKHLR